MLRFAPSLTGELHLGNLASAVLNRCLADRLGYPLVWRVDGLVSRENLPLVRAQMTTMARFGLRFDACKVVRVSRASYSSLVPHLARFMYAEGGDECRRLDLLSLNGGAAKLSWTEPTGASRSVDLSRLKDPIVTRGDGTMLYGLYSALWDVTNGTEVVVRGNDLLSSSVTQVLVHKFFSSHTRFLHHGLVMLNGKKLSKQGTVPMTLHELEARWRRPAVACAWVVRHYKRFHKEALGFGNIGPSNKNLVVEEFERWMVRNGAGWRA